MKICLIRLPAIDVFRFATTSISMPLGLAYIAAALERSGAQISVIDAIAEAPHKRTRCYKGFLVGLLPEDIVSRIPADAEVIGISVIFTHEWPVLVHLVDLIKRDRPNATIVLGGEHVTSMPEFCLLTSKADAIVLGEGEATIVELVEHLGAGKPLSAVAGIGYREGERVVVNPRRARETKVDEIPWPAWHYFKPEVYSALGYVGGMNTKVLTIPILATRGCPYQCTYCSSANMWTPNWIPRTPKGVVDEIQHLHETFGARNFPFQDLTAIISKDWIIEFCNELKSRQMDIIWQLPSGTRSEAIDGEVAALLRSTGMVNMAYAPESGSETTRRFIKKKMKTENLMRSIRAAAEADLNLSCFIVIGFPHDTPESLQENLDFIDRIAEAGVVDMGVAFYMALPGTELFHSLYDAGRITLNRAYFRHILDQLTLIPSQTYCDSLSRWDLFRWKLRLLLRFYSAKRKASRRAGLASSVRRAVSGLFVKGHSSKLQTVFLNATVNAWYQLRVYCKSAWMPRTAEDGLFADFDRVFRRIREEKLRAAIVQPSPSDTRELHRSSVVHTLRGDHEARKVFVLNESGVCLEE